MTRRWLAYAFPFMDSLDPLAPADTDTAAPDDTLQMDEDTFRGFYARTSGMVWAYLARATGDPAAADDLLQESYYRLLRTTTQFESEDHRKNYLFRIATNLLRDRYRRPRLDHAQLPEHGEGDIPAARRSRARNSAAHRSAARPGAADPARARARVCSPTVKDRRTRKSRAPWVSRRAASSRCCFAPGASLRAYCDHDRDWRDWGLGTGCECGKPECPVCAELAAIAKIVRDDFEHATRQARVPTAEIVWWRAQMRAREDAARAAARPILFTQALAVAAAIGLDHFAGGPVHAAGALMDDCVAHVRRICRCAPSPSPPAAGSCSRRLPSTSPLRARNKSVTGTGVTGSSADGSQSRCGGSSRDSTRCRRSNGFAAAGSPRAST